MMLSKWLNSLRIYSLSVISVHFVVFTFFFPYFILYTFFILLIFAVAWAWCDLVNYIEQSNRNEILHLLDTCTNDKTKDALAHQLFLHDKNSVFGDPHRLFGVL